ncbi:MAG: A/G-specific adenine glycosylase [Gemmataceae bacterium]
MSDALTLAPSHFRQVRRRLLTWFDQARRDLPWRRTRDPYAIWVSEVMLQQTQVATVIPYFQRFLEAFPTVTDLANASEQQVLRWWEGLGYYRRAVNLHRAAQRLVAEQGGQCPDDPAVWGELPGVGRYILGAVLSQAFERRLPIVEANSQRVLCRLFGQAGDPRGGPTRRWLWRTAEALLPRRRVGDFNQALMELGALVCTAARPRCDDCPLASLCQARRHGLQDVIPGSSARPAPVEVREAAVVPCKQGRVLLARRPATGRWANLWEFPHGPLADDESHAAAARRVLRDLTGIDADLGPELLTIRHGVTHHRITLVCFEADWRGGDFRSTFYTQALWLPPEDLCHYPVSSPQRQLARWLLQETRQRGLF